MSLPVGMHAITLTAMDEHRGTSSDVMIVTVVDRTPPAIQSAAATPSVLSPANTSSSPSPSASTCRTRAADWCAARLRQWRAATGPGEDRIVTGDLTLKCARNG